MYNTANAPTRGHGAQTWDMDGLHGAWPDQFHERLAAKQEGGNMKIESHAKHHNAEHPRERRRGANSKVTSEV